MITIATGHSDDIHPMAALEAAAAQCRAGLGARQAGALLLFCSVADADHQAMLAVLAERFPGTCLVGCTSDGEFGGDEPFQEDAVALLALAADGVTFSSGRGEGMSGDPAGAVARALAEARERLDGPEKLAVWLCDSEAGVTENVHDILQDAAAPGSMIFGSNGAARSRMRRSRQFHGRDVLRDAAVVLLVSGALCCSVGAACGWEPLGREHAVERAEGNVLYEIGGMNASEFYRHYFGEGIEAINQFPLAFLDPDEPGGFTLRAPLPSRRETPDGGIRFIGKIPAWPKARLTEAGREEILAAAAEAARTALEDYPGDHPALALAFSCSTRRQILGSRTDEENRAVRDNLPENTDIFGFYGFGQICPARTGARAESHCDAVTVLLLGAE